MIDENEKCCFIFGDGRGLSHIKCVEAPKEITNEHPLVTKTPKEWEDLCNRE
jgi:hypothetical protein